MRLTNVSECGRVVSASGCSLVGLRSPIRGAYRARSNDGAIILPDLWRECDGYNTRKGKKSGYSTISFLAPAASAGIRSLAGGGFQPSIVETLMATLTISDLNTEVNHEPRIHDLRIAENLGMSRKRDIRKLIERNIAELERYGTCATVSRVVRGNQVTEYYLNEPQALLICVKSDAPNSPDARQRIIEIYMAYRRGALVPAMVTPEQKAALKAAMHERHAVVGVPYPALWGRFNNHFKIAEYKELPATRFDEALAYIGQMFSEKALPAPDKDTVTLPRLMPTVQIGGCRHDLDVLSDCLCELDLLVEAAPESEERRQYRLPIKAILTKAQETTKQISRNMTDFQEAYLPINVAMPRLTN